MAAEEIRIRMVSQLRRDLDAWRATSLAWRSHHRIHSKDGRRRRPAARSGDTSRLDRPSWDLSPLRPHFELHATGRFNRAALSRRLCALFAPAENVTRL
jgi:hypothetical protein